MLSYVANRRHEQSGHVQRTMRRLKLMATEDTPQLSPLSSEDGKEAQKSLDHLDKNGTPKVTTKGTGFQGKTLWDWLQLLGVLAIPLVVAGATLLFSLQQANLAQQQHENDQKIANQQRLQDQALALDQQRQAVLVKYQDDMRDLLLNKGLLTSKPGDEIRIIALTETLSAMSQLDPKRISFLIRFLQYAHLNAASETINKHNVRIEQVDNIVNFSDTDLSAIDFTNANLGSADLSGANLNNANLVGAHLNNADLSHANLHDANLTGAHLVGTNFTGADLSFTVLSGTLMLATNLAGADLSQTELSGANLSDAILTGANLSGADLGDV